MEIAKARAIADRVVGALAPYCWKSEIAGSIRRGKADVHDIDIVAIPNNQGQFYYALQQLGPVKGGKKTLKLTLPEISADIYIATPETYTTLVLIRTGSARHNVMLCKMARLMGMVLHADGRGLARPTNIYPDFEELIPCDTESDIFEALGLPYKEPHERE